LTGRIVHINTSSGGIPKRAVASATLTPHGIEGDSWSHPRLHGGPNQAVLLIALETIEELQHLGYPVQAGSLGENLTTEGLDYTQIRIGHQFRTGEALLEITKVRVPCATLDIYGPAIKDEIYDAQVKAGEASSPRWGKSGFYARVVRPGPLWPGDIIALVAALA
jgi:MOSC domain-containing protein YiiM